MGGCGCGCGPGPEGADSTPCHLLLLLLRVRASPSPAVAPCPTFLLTGERTLRDEDIAEDIAPVGVNPLGNYAVQVGGCTHGCLVGRSVAAAAASVYRLVYACSAHQDSAEGLLMLGVLRSVFCCAHACLCARLLICCAAVLLCRSPGRADSTRSHPLICWSA